MSGGQTLPAFRSILALRGGLAVRRAQISTGVALALVFVLFLLAAALFPAYFAPADPLATDPRHIFAAPSAMHFLGTDENGRDAWSRLIHGVRPSLLLGLASASITISIGVLLGLCAGLGPTLLANLIMRLVDILQSLPAILLALLIIALWGAGNGSLLVALGIGGVAAPARQVRAQALVIRHAPFVEAARTLGLPGALIIIRHVLPNAIKPALVILPIELGWKISFIATLSFLGFGAAPPAPEWGTTLAIDHDYILNACWLTAVPAVFITLTVISVNTLGRELIRRSEGRR